MIEGHMELQHVRSLWKLLRFPAPPRHRTAGDLREAPSRSHCRRRLGPARWTHSEATRAAPPMVQLRKPWYSAVWNTWARPKKRVTPFLDALLWISVLLLFVVLCLEVLSRINIVLNIWHVWYFFCQRKYKTHILNTFFTTCVSNIFLRHTFNKYYKDCFLSFENLVCIFVVIHVL